MNGSAGVSSFVTPGFLSLNGSTCSGSGRRFVLTAGQYAPRLISPHASCISADCVRTRGGGGVTLQPTHPTIKQVTNQPNNQLTDRPPAHFIGRWDILYPCLRRQIPAIVSFVVVVVDSDPQHSFSSAPPQSETEDLSTHQTMTP